MKTISERGRDRPAQDETTSDIEIGVQVEVCNQTSHFSHYNGQVGVVEEIDDVCAHDRLLFPVRLQNQQTLLLYREEIEIVNDEK